MIASFGRLELFGTGRNIWDQTLGVKERWGDHGKKSVRFYTDVGHKSGIGKRLFEAIATKPNVAITVGVGALAANRDDLLADVALPAIGTTTFLNAYSLGAGVLDYPRTIAFKAGAGVGDGTFVGASAKGVLIVGTDYKGHVIKETIPLNGATAVESKKAFKTVTSLTPALNFVGGTDHIACGSGGSFAIQRPCASSSDLVEYGTKASAATAYTIATLPTTDVGEAYATLGTGGTGDQTLSSTATTINLPTGLGSAFPSARAMAEIIDPNGNVEEIIITAKSTDALTVVRGANGSTARAHSRGCVIAWRPGMTFTPGSITANDRFKLKFLGDVD